MVLASESVSGQVWAWVWELALVVLLIDSYQPSGSRYDHQPVACAEPSVRTADGRLGRLNRRTKIPRPDVRTRTPIEGVELSAARTNVYIAVDYDWRGT